MPRRNEEMQAIGDSLISYSAAQLPTGYIEGVHREVSDEFRKGERGATSTIQILDLLVRIAVTKLKAAA
jgi:hypothetical protein